MATVEQFSRAYAIWIASGGLSRLRRVVEQAAAEASPLVAQGFEVPTEPALLSLATTIGEQIPQRSGLPPGAVTDDWLALYSTMRGLSDAVDLRFSNAWSMLQADPAWFQAVRLASDALAIWGRGGRDQAALQKTIERSYHLYQQENR